MGNNRFLGRAKGVEGLNVPCGSFGLEAEQPKTLVGSCPMAKVKLS